MGTYDAKPVGESRTALVPTDITEAHGESHTGITIFDKTEPRSVYNLTSNELRDAIDRVHPETWKLSFKNIEKKAGDNATLAQLRVAFWHEYSETQDKWKKGISLVRVMHGICSKPTFYAFLRDQYKVAYLLYPTTDYMSAMLEMQDLATREIRKILKIPNSGAKGANLAVIREKIKIFALLENRLRGSVPRRMQAEHKHLHASVPAEILQNHQKAPESLEQIEKEINRIDRTVREQTKSPRDSKETPRELKTRVSSEDPLAGDNS